MSQVQEGGVTCDLSYLADKDRRVPALGQLKQHGRILSLTKLSTEQAMWLGSKAHASMHKTLNFSINHQSTNQSIKTNTLVYLSPSNPKMNPYKVTLLVSRLLEVTKPQWQGSMTSTHAFQKELLK